MELDRELYHHVDILQMDGPHDVVYEEIDRTTDLDVALDIGRGLYYSGFIVRITDSRGKLEWQS